MKRLFAVFFFVCVFVMSQPSITLARYTEANVQCPPGGKVKQPCKDNTNGYVTQGTCAYVYVCKADNVKSQEPPICAGGKSDCPIGGPPPSSFNPYPRPVKIASTSTPIPKTGISGVEQSVLDQVFGNSDTIDPSVDLVQVAEKANVELLATQEYSKTDDLLTYAPQSFDAKTSTLFASLREQAVALFPGQSPGTVNTNSAVKFGFPSGTPIGTSFGAPGSSLEGRMNVGKEISVDLMGSGAYFAQGIGSVLHALISVILADFTAASQAWADAKINFSLAFSHFGRAVAALWHELITLILSSIVAHADELDANTQCASGNYQYDYRKEQTREKPCDDKDVKCMLNFPCESAVARGYCEAEGKCRAISVKVCDANSGQCDWTKPQITALPPRLESPSTTSLPPTPQSGPSGISSEIEKAFQTETPAAAQARVDTAAQRLQEAFNKLQNDPAHFSQNFDEVRAAQDELAVAKRLQENAISPSLRDYIRGIIAPRMTPTDVLPDGSPAVPSRTYQWFNNFGSTPAPLETFGSLMGFDPFKVAAGDVPPELIRQAEEGKLQRFLDDWVLIGQKEFNETYRNWLRAEVTSPWTEVRVPSLAVEPPIGVTRYSVALNTFHEFWHFIAQKRHIMVSNDRREQGRVFSCSRTFVVHSFLIAACFECAVGSGERDCRSIL